MLKRSALLVLALSGCFHRADVPRRPAGGREDTIDDYTYRRIPTAADQTMVQTSQGSREVGIIEVGAIDPIYGLPGLLTSEADFYPQLTKYATELGGNRFTVVATQRNPYGWMIVHLTVRVFATSSSTSEL
jgi:hypothetical protein